MTKFSPKQLGKAIGLSESTLKRWIDAGQLVVERTPGGHRRVSLPEAIRFIREQRLRVQDPVLLGLSTDVANAVEMDRSEHAAALVDLLIGGDAIGAKASIVRAFIDGVPLGALCDETIQRVLCELGELWGCSGEEDWEGLAAEHLATETCVRAISEIRALIPEPGRDAPVAIGAAPAGDPYILPGFMAAAALAEVGFRVINLGPNVPMPALTAAAQRHRPLLGFVSITSPPPPLLGDELTRVAEVFGEMRSVVIIGGQSRHGVFKSPGAMPHPIVGAGSITELGAFARGLINAGRDKPDHRHSGGTP